MLTNIKTVLTFISGIAVGVISTYKIAEQKYKKRTDEDVKSVIERFSNREPLEIVEEHLTESEEKKEVKSEKKTAVPTKSSLTEYVSVVEKVGYNKISSQSTRDESSKEEVKELRVANDSIYTISPDEFNTLDDFGMETMYYTSDNYLLNSDYEELSDFDVKRTVGKDPYGSFGEYEDSAVYVRNEELMCDYEILLSEKTRAEIQEG